MYLKRIVRIGKNKVHLGIEDYLRKIAAIEVINVKEEKGNNRELIKQKEGEKLLDRVIGYTLALSEEGSQIDSVTFAKMIEKYPDISFIIGGAFGLSEEVKKKADYVLSLSKMTLPHELAYLVLVEQIYRAERILEGHPYHKN